MRMTTFAVASLCSMVCTGAVGVANDAPHMDAADLPCACVAQNRRYAQGDFACIAGIRMVCGMNQNVTAWLSKGEPCQTSTIAGGWSNLWLEPAGRAARSTLLR